MRLITRIIYYIKSIWEIIIGFTNPFSFLFHFLFRQSEKPEVLQKVILAKSGLMFWVRSPMDVWSIKETFLDNFYRFSEKDLPRNGTIIDIGAGIGEFSIQAAAACPDCQVIGFEPFPESFQLFEKNILSNNIKNVKAVQAAVGSKLGQVSMDTSTGNPLQYRAQYSVQDIEVEKIQTINLSEFMTQMNIQHCDFLKLDCEGSEFDILLTMSQKDLSRFSNIVMEYHDMFLQNHHNEIVQALLSAGFRVEETHNAVHENLGYIYAQIHRESAVN